MRSTLSFNFDRESLQQFDAQCEVAISKLGHGTRKATVAACQEIIQASLNQVPSATGTLASSIYYEISGNYKIGFSGVVGYGGNGNPVNPTTGEAVSEYMVAVHENMSAEHPNGKAKFLEDPVREYARENFPRTVFKYAQESLADMSL